MTSYWPQLYGIGATICHVPFPKNVFENFTVLVFYKYVVFGWFCVFLRVGKIIDIHLFHSSSFVFCVRAFIPNLHRAVRTPKILQE